MDAYEALCREMGEEPASVALAWLQSNPVVTAPIIGPRTMAHLEDNLGAVAVEISDADRARLDEAATPEQAIVSYYTGQAMDFAPSQYRW